MKLLYDNLIKTNGKISTYASKPFNLYHLMGFINYFPIDMHYDLLDSTYSILKPLLSENAKKQYLIYYYSFIKKEQDLYKDYDRQNNKKPPNYMEKIISYYFQIDLKHTWHFIYENDEDINNNQRNEDEEYIGEDDIQDDNSNDNENDLDLSNVFNIINKMVKKYNLKSPL